MDGGNGDRGEHRSVEVGGTAIAVAEKEARRYALKGKELPIEGGVDIPGVGGQWCGTSAEGKGLGEKKKSVSLELGLWGERFGVTTRRLKE